MSNLKNRSFVALLALLIFLLTPSLAYADEAIGNMELDVSGYHVRLNFSAPTHVGKNEFHVFLLDWDTTPLKDSRVNLVAAPVELTPEHQADMEKGPALAGHFILHNVVELPTPDSSGIPVDWGSDQIEHPADHILLTMQPGQNPGEYVGTVSFPQAGHWMLLFDFNGRGKSYLAQFPLNITDPPNGSTPIIAGVLGIIVVLAILVASKVRKSKTFLQP